MPLKLTGCLLILPNGAGERARVLRVTPYMALTAIYNSNHDHYNINPPGTDRFKVKIHFHHSKTHGV